MESVESARIVALVLDDKVDIGSRDAALYQMLTELLREKLQRRFRSYERRVPFTFEDVLQEYFLYLRGDVRNVYAIFKNLNDVSTFEAWLVATFRNFVSKKARRAGVRAIAVDVSNMSDTPGFQKHEMNPVAVLSTMIAYCYQELPLVRRFVFLRMILTYLDKDRALPQKDVAMVLGLSHIYYRVLCTRVKSFSVQVKGRILGGEELVLNQNALGMKNKLEEDFCDWYELLSSYYAVTIDKFEQADEINALRCSYCLADSPDLLLHDVVSE